jgi:hypothetical protein
MTGTGGDLAGTLTLTGHDVWAADQATLVKLEADPNYAARDTDLANNPGTLKEGGYLEAAGIAVDLLGSSLMVQNSGTALQPAGLSIGSGGLTITNQGSDPATVIVYGRAIAGGVTSSGRDFVPLVIAIGTFTGDSRINGCDLGGCAPLAPPTTATGAESILGPVGLMTDTAAIVEQDAAEDFTDDLFFFGIGSGLGEGDDPTSPPDFWQGPINTGLISGDRPIDDPVTSGSDGAASEGPK